MFNVFFPIKTTHLLYKVFLSLDQGSLGLKNDIKYTKDVDVSNAPCCSTPNVLSPKHIPVAMAATVLMSHQSPI